MPRLLAATCLLAAPALAAEPPVAVIFDTDMDTDCDDAGALGVLHALADRGECQILATVVSVTHPTSAPTVAAINAWYGRPELPIGAPRQHGTAHRSAYTDGIAREFPGPLKSTAEADDAVAVYRRVLEQQPDGAVVVVTVGYLTNLRNLLELPAAEGHPSGRELVARKVKRYVCMGGNFVGTPPHDDLKLGNVNFTRDPESALRVVRGWPGPLVFVGREIGSVPSGLSLGTCLAQTPANNPVRRAYELYFGGKLQNRHVADLVTVLYAVRGPRDLWDVEPHGWMDLHPDMTFDWRSTPDRDRAYLRKRRGPDGRTQDRAIEAVLAELVTRPPAATAAPAEEERRR